MWNALSWQLEQDVAMEGKCTRLRSRGFSRCAATRAYSYSTGSYCWTQQGLEPREPRDALRLHVSTEMPSVHLQRTYSVQLKIDASPEVRTACNDGAIHCWGFDAAQNKFHLKQKLEGHVLGVTSLSLFTSGGTFLLSGSMDRTVRVWSVDSGRPARVY